MSEQEAFDKLLSVGDALMKHVDEVLEPRRKKAVSESNHGTAEELYETELLLIRQTKVLMKAVCELADIPLPPHLKNLIS